MSTLVRCFLPLALVVAAWVSTAAPADVLPDWSSSSPCPVGRVLVDTEVAGQMPASGVDVDGLTCEVPR